MMHDFGTYLFEYQSFCFFNLTCHCIILLVKCVKVSIFLGLPRAPQKLGLALGFLVN